MMFGEGGPMAGLLGGAGRRPVEVEGAAGYNATAPANLKRTKAS
jgi:hypothetical protein